MNYLETQSILDNWNKNGYADVFNNTQIFMAEEYPERGWFPKSESSFKQWLSSLSNFYNLVEMLGIPLSDDYKYHIYTDTMVNGKKGFIITNEAGSKFDFNSFNVLDTESHIQAPSKENIIELSKSKLYKRYSKSYHIERIYTQNLDVDKFLVKYQPSYFKHAFNHIPQVEMTANFCNTKLLYQESLGNNFSTVRTYALYKSNIVVMLAATQSGFLRSPDIDRNKSYLSFMCFLPPIPKDRLFNFSFFSNENEQREFEIFMSIAILKFLPKKPDILYNVPKPFQALIGG